MNEIYRDPRIVSDYQGRPTLGSDFHDLLVTEERPSLFTPLKTSLRDGKARREESKKNVTKAMKTGIEGALDQVEIKNSAGGPRLSTRAPRGANATHKE